MDLIDIKISIVFSFLVEKFMAIQMNNKVGQGCITGYQEYRPSII